VLEVSLQGLLVFELDHGSEVEPVSGLGAVTAVAELQQAGDLVRQGRRGLEGLPHLLIGGAGLELQQDDVLDHGYRTPLLAIGYVKALTPVMSRPTISAWIVAVPSKVWIASMSAMWRITW